MDANGRELGLGDGDDKIMGPEVWQKNELSEIWVPIWSALRAGQLSPSAGKEGEMTGSWGRGFFNRGDFEQEETYADMRIMRT
ncbi:hypothetical protein SBV1_1140004 [Verrucomicrobia bacterium]|nr:hypothetical protein SBV1_1140004 [Verrucomicrobiota bacterium]